MPGLETVAERNLDGYGAPIVEWSRVRHMLANQLTQAPDTGGPNRHTLWLSTANADGSPHVRPLGVVSVADTWYFTSGPGTRKSRNLGRTHAVCSASPPTRSTS